MNLKPKKQRKRKKKKLDFKRCQNQLFVFIQLSHVKFWNICKCNKYLVFKKKMSFIDLPNDCIWCIIEYFKSSKDLMSLILTCKKVKVFFYISSHLGFRNIKFYNSIKSKSKINPYFKQHIFNMKLELNYSNLYELFIFDKKFEGIKKLKRLKLYDVEVIMLSKFSYLDLTNLEELNLSENSICKIEGLKTFTKLKKLKLSNNSIRKIEGLETLTKLTYLNLSYNHITKIEGLLTLTNLRVLYLNNNNLCELKSELIIENSIWKIEGLDTLTNLVELFLNNNNIQKIEGLDTLKNLEKLNLNNNLITWIGGLDKLNLTICCLDNNKIKNLIKYDKKYWFLK